MGFVSKTQQRFQIQQFSEMENLTLFLTVKGLNI